MEQYPERDFEEAAEHLRGLIDEAISKETIERMADVSVNLMYDVLEANDGKVEHLFAVVLKYGRQNDGYTNPPSDQHAQLRRRVVGDGHEASRAKILAMVLSTRAGPASDIWTHFMRSLGLGDRTGIAPRFRDKFLPFSEDDLKGYFGEGALHLLHENQHIYCPVDLESRNYHQTQVRLKDIINNPPYLRICKKHDADEKSSSSDYFCPEGMADRFVVENEDLVKKLCIEAYKECGSPSTSPRERREFLEAAKTEANQFYQGVKPRAKLLAAIISCKAEADSTIWRNFTSICLGKPSSSLEGFDEFCDESLPLEHDTLKKYLGADNIDDLDNWQYRFCAVELIPPTQRPITSRTRLPLLEKRKIGSGGYGYVYCVKIAKGHLREEQEDTEVAMKITKATRPDKEWGDAQELFQKQDMDSHNIMKAIASLRSPEQIYIFFPLALCDLNVYMRGKSESGCAAGPVDSEDRLKFFNLIIGIAHALKYLHRDLQVSEERDRVVLIHEDLKTDNILIRKSDKNEKGIIFQITDFGISKIRHAPRSSPEWITIEKDRTSEPEPRSLRDIEDLTVLGSQCPNYAPEARTQGRNVTSKVDIWAYGTVFAEYVAWLSGGKETLMTYTAARGGGNDPRERGDYYLSFEIDPKSETAEVKKGIWPWFSKLIEETQDQDDRNLYRNCTALLREHLLQCEPSKRAKIEDVYDYLTRILNHRVENEAPNGDMDGESIPSSTNREDVLPSTNEKTISLSTNKEVIPPDVDEEFFLPNTNEKATSLTKSNTRTSGRNDPLFTTKSSGESLPTVLPARKKSGSKDRYGRTRLLVALAEGDDDKALRILEQGCQLDVSDKYQWTALHHAVQLGNQTLVQQLLSRQPDLVDMKQQDGKTALHMCADDSGHAASVAHARHLLERNASVNIKDSSGRTAIHFATKEIPNEHRIEMVRLLLENGADVERGRLGIACERYDDVRVALGTNARRGRR